MARERVVIIGAAGRDFHNFNTYFRGNDRYEVVAFTATQIPDIEGRKYPASLCGPGYPDGIPVVAEEDLPELIEEEAIDTAVFAYSDVLHEHVMHIASYVLASGANFMLLGARQTQIKSKVPVISVCAVRTGCGKSQTTRRVVEILQAKGKRVVAIRHPMPYGDLEKQRCQRFADYDDLDKHETTIEEREEYEPHIDRGIVVYAGVDYQDILNEAEKEADVIVWDGGNNDLPFYVSDLQIVVVDPHRAGHETTYHPGETNLLSADVVVINKIDTADLSDIMELRETIGELNEEAVVIDAASPLTVDDFESIRGKTVLCVEDGPTLTHGEMELGAAVIAAWKFGAEEVVDPKPYAVGSIRETFEKYDHIEGLLPAMGYGAEQTAELAETINRVDCDLVISGTPIDLSRIMKVNKPILRVQYDLQEIGKPDLEDTIDEWMTGISEKG